MTRHFSLATEAIVSVADAGGCVPDIAEHLEVHGARFLAGNATVLDFDFSRGVLEPQDGFLRLRAGSGLNLLRFGQSAQTSPSYRQILGCFFFNPTAVKATLAICTTTGQGV